MRLVLLLVAIASFVAGAAISPEEIAAARQTCLRSCNGGDKVAVAKCMRACWKNFFDNHHHKGANRMVVAHPKINKPRHVAPIAKKKGITHPRHPTKSRSVKRVFVAEHHQRLEGRMGPTQRRSMAALLRTGASSIAVNAGLLVSLLAVSAFLMAN